MHVVLQSAEGWLDLQAPDVGLAERRPVTAADHERCNAWATQYRRRRVARVPKPAWWRWGGRCTPGSNGFWLMPCRRWCLSSRPR